MEILVVIVIAAAALAAVIVPLVRGARDRDPHLEVAPEAPGNADAPPDLEDIEAEILRYRGALRMGTVCLRCGQANPAGSRFCYECGRRLHPPQPARDAVRKLIRR